MQSILQQFFNWITFPAAVTSSTYAAVSVESSILLAMSTIISIIEIIAMAYSTIAIGSPWVAPSQNLILFAAMMKSREWRE